MKVVITGMNGTVAPVLGAHLHQAGFEVVGWDRQAVPPEDEAAGRAFLDGQKPDWVCHLALGSERWGAFLAESCRQQGIGFLFTSSVMVFSNEPDGPHRVGDDRSTQDEYGRYKIRCEDQILAASDEAIIVRIGWQIGRSRGGNHMVETLHQTAERGEPLRCSTLWRPATSFLDDTAAGIAALMARREPGVFHFDSNAVDGLTYYEIVQGLKALLGTSWDVQPEESYRHDQRLLDQQLHPPSLARQLALKT